MAGRQSIVLIPSPVARVRRSGARGSAVAVSAAAKPVIEALEGRQLMAANLPSGFAESKIGGGFGEPTDMAVTPDGRIFVTEKNGAVRVVKNGALLSTPFTSLSVDSYRDRGLDAIALDP